MARFGEAGMAWRCLSRLDEVRRVVARQVKAGVARNGLAARGVASMVGLVWFR